MAATGNTPEMVDIGEAHAIVCRTVRPGLTEHVPLDQAVNRTLAAPIQTDIAFPPFTRAVMDGFAVIAADTCADGCVLRILGRSPAGGMFAGKIESGECVRINTGAPIPPGADAVVRIEDCEIHAEGHSVAIMKGVTPNTFVSRKATFASEGQEVIAAGMRLMPLEIDAAASAGAADVEVYRRPQIAILSTGDELVDVDVKPAEGQIRNSNAYLLASAIERAGAVPHPLGVARDDIESLLTCVKRGLTCDAICVTGGVSMGDRDYVPDVLDACGVTFHFRKMRIKPGRPTLFGSTNGGSLAFALPGNPVSAFIGFEFLVRPALRIMQGLPAAPPIFESAKLDGSLTVTRDRRAFRPARTSVDHDGKTWVRPLRWHGSGDPFGMAGADCLIVQPPDDDAQSHGDHVMIHRLGDGL